MNIDDLLGPVEKKKKYRKLKRLIKKPHPISGYRNIDFLKLLPQLSWWEEYNSEEQELIFRWLADDPDFLFLQGDDVSRNLHLKFEEMYSDDMPWSVWQGGGTEDWIKEEIWTELEYEFRRQNK